MMVSVEIQILLLLICCFGWVVGASGLAGSVGLVGRVTFETKTEEYLIDNVSDFVEYCNK